MTASTSRIYLRLEERSGRDQIRDALVALVEGVDDLEAWGRQLAHACDVAGAPWWVRGEALQVGDHPHLAPNAAWAARMWLSGWSREDWKTWLPALAGADDLGQDVVQAPWQPDGSRVDGLDLPFPRKHDAAGVQRADEFDEAWWAEHQAGVASCRTTAGMWWIGASGELDHGHITHKLGCGRRACPQCSKAAQWRGVSRYLTGFAAPLDRAHRLEMTTLTSTRPVSTPRELQKWRKGAAQVCKAMVQGRSTLGIPEGAWKGGLIVVETVRKGDGLQYAHAHLLVVARRWYPYGRSLRKAHGPRKLGAKGQASEEGLFDLVDKARTRRRHRRNTCEAGERIAPSGPARYTPTGRLRLELADRAASVLNRRRAARGLPPRYAAGPLRWVIPSERDPWRHRQREGWKPWRVRWRGRWIKLRDPRELFGLRELLRRNHIGEVVDVTLVNQQTDAKGAVMRYLGKVQAYAAKVQTDDPSAAGFWTDPQVQWTLKGARRVQPFGCFMKLHAGPTKRGAELTPGQDHRRSLTDVVPVEYVDGLVEEQIRFRGDERELQRRRVEHGIPWIVPDPGERFTLHRFNMSRLRQWQHARVKPVIDLVHRRSRPRFTPKPLYPAPQPRPVEIKRKPREISREVRAEWQPSLWPGGERPCPPNVAWWQIRTDLGLDRSADCRR